MRKLIVNILLCFIAFVPVSSKALTLQSFDGVYEPSAVAQLSDGSIVVVEDEGDQPLHLFAIRSKESELILNARTFESKQIKADDLEAIAKGRKGEFFLITSHSVTKKGKRKKKREHLIKITMGNKGVNTTNTAGSLTLSMQNHLEKILPLKTKELENINIEGMAFHPARKALLIGLRSPTHDKKALILTLLNPFDLTEKGSKPIFSEQVITLNLEGAGIRGLAYDEGQDSFLVAGEAANKKGKLRSRIWMWNGKADHQPVRLKLPKRKGVKNIEGISIVNHAGSAYLLYVCDNGKKKENQGANYGFIATRDLYSF